MIRIVAALGALAHFYFAYQEIFGWTPAFVRKAANTWMRDPGLDDSHVAWSRNLAFNVGVYNLVLAVGLAWTAVADPGLAGTVSGFFTFWLLAAAAAAAYTKVRLAFVAQGLLGLLLGIATLAH